MKWCLIVRADIWVDEGRTDWEIFRCALHASDWWSMLVVDSQYDAFSFCCLIVGKLKRQHISDTFSHRSSFAGLRFLLLNFHAKTAAGQNLNKHIISTVSCVNSKAQTKFWNWKRRSVAFYRCHTYILFMFYFSFFTSDVICYRSHSSTPLYLWYVLTVRIRPKISPKINNK